ncbi:MAG: response regulator [Agriterribacter sp.]
MLDILLPDGNGFELCMHLKLSETTRHIPIVLMSANLNPKELESNPCGEDFIAKPFDVNEFFSKVHKQIA